MYKYRYCILGTLFIIFDQLTKYWALHQCFLEKKITDFLSFELLCNTGIVFGWTAQSGMLVFWTLTVIAAFLIMYLIKMMMVRKRMGYNVVGELLLIVGGLSNIFDRIYHHAVIDFIHLHYGAWSFPYFNLADIYITCGVLILFVRDFFEN